MLFRTAKRIKWPLERNSSFIITRARYVSAVLTLMFISLAISLLVLQSASSLNGSGSLGDNIPRHCPALSRILVSALLIGIP